MDESGHRRMLWTGESNVLFSCVCLCLLLLLLLLCVFSVLIIP